MMSEIWTMAVATDLKPLDYSHQLYMTSLGRQVLLLECDVQVHCQNKGRSESCKDA